MDINIINIDNFDINDINLSRSISINSYKKKISIGYKDNTELYLLTPLITNNINYQNDKYQFLKILFDPFLGQILNFYNIIISIEKYIKEHIHKNNPKYILNSIIKNDKQDLFDDDGSECIKAMLLRLNNYKVYDNNSNECELSLLKVGWKFKALIKIDYIWIDIDKKKFGLNIELIQLKIIQPITQIRCLIDNDIPIRRKITKIPEPIRPIANVINEFRETEEQKEEEKPVSIFKPPNPLELLKMKNALKKVID